MPRLPLRPRPLSDLERTVLEHILSADFAGASALRSQLDRTEVVALWAPGSASVNLRVREPAHHAAMSAELVPVDAHVHDQSGEYIGELLVWTDRGATLAALEYSWLTDEMPSSLPRVDQVMVSVR
ncbi:hypothetical protein O1Q96_20455 [Streptomyces sp. Qhu-G9]|uniref:hypothetical protein n=1 Tax=Streptomyces sp. Qhu-G9 TaxID=3452799 RepID=UPI0022AC4208|nr:hypothetical protein [Streptomyces aurantiacus]WAU81951.1 hypothetical protein O1Q96_20455 [Streptomyces aurantiacus]